MSVSKISSVVAMGLILGCTAMPKTAQEKHPAGALEPGTIISTSTGKPVSFADMVSDLLQSRVIYVGESHTRRSDHAAQLKVIEAVFQRHPNLAVGMEMFDRSYQQVLDQWSAGELDEQSFLRKTQWYANWRYDYSLYRSILEYVRNHRIRLIGLNIPFDIPAKIRVGGIDNLLPQDKRYIPADIDTTNTAQREYLAEVFKRHEFSGHTTFEDFYMAQCVWDEAMAEAVARNLNDDIMIVLAGNGHIQYKYGIPQRAFRRTGVPFRTIYLDSSGQQFDRAIADYIWVTADGEDRSQMTDE
jgi:uncharacterized iron-regulated protein